MHPFRRTPWVSISSPAGIAAVLVVVRRQATACSALGGTTRCCCCACSPWSTSRCWCCARKRWSTSTSGRRRGRRSWAPCCALYLAIPGLSGRPGRDYYIAARAARRSASCCGSSTGCTCTGSGEAHVVKEFDPQTAQGLTVGSPLMTGEQLEITRGDARAVVTTVGAGLRAFEVAGVPYVETYARRAADGRRRGARAVAQPGGRRDLDPRRRDAPARGDGSGARQRDPRPGAPRDRGRSRRVRRVGHAARRAVDGAPGWPFPFRTTISYTLGDDGLTITHTACTTAASGTCRSASARTPTPGRATPTSTSAC